MRVPARELEGRELPHWYGIAWHIYYRDEVVLFPVPFNLIARVAHAAYWLAFRFFKFGPRALKGRNDYWRGYEDGQHNQEKRK